MKKIYRAVLLMLGLQSMSMYAAQESKQNIELGRQTMIDNTVKNLTYLTDGFDFLRTQNLVDTSFHDFLEQNISHDEDGNEDMNFDQVIVDAEDVLTKNMKDAFLKPLNITIRTNYLHRQSDEPVFLYVMQHKNDSGMRNMLRLWLHESNKDSRTLLYDALERDDTEIASMLIAAGADVNIKNEFGMTLLQNAVLWDDVEKARMLLAGSADVNIKDKNGYSPLCYAVANDNKEIVKMLITAGANPYIQDEYGKTHFIYQDKNDEIIKFAKDDLIMAELIYQDKKAAQKKQKQQEKADAQVNDPKRLAIDHEL